MLSEFLGLWAVEILASIRNYQKKETFSPVLLCRFTRELHDQFRTFFHNRVPKFPPV
jgi:hypothetical protein